MSEMNLNQWAYRKPIKAYANGERIGTLTVSKYIEHTAINLAVLDEKGKTEIMSKKMHWYEVRCDCGAESIVMNQERIRQRMTCIECATDRKISRLKRYQIGKESGVPDFAKLPVPESITTGPDIYKVKQ